MLDELKGVRVLVETCGALKPGENVVVVTDSEKKDIADLIAGMCVAYGGNTVKVCMTPRSGHREEPPEAVARALIGADLIIAVTTFSLFHSAARIKACQSGARWVNAAAYTREMLKHGGLMTDFRKQRKIAEAVAARLTKANDVHVTTTAGTDISFSIAGRTAIAEGGISDQRGMINSPPDIEVCIAPVEGTAKGVIVIDGSIVQPGLGPLTNTVTVDVENGSVTNVRGGAEAKIFSDLLSAANDHGVYNIGEFGIGLNPNCRLCGSMLEDEGVYGTAHFGIGDNHTMGGVVDAKLHSDSIFWHPTVVVDGETLIMDGELCELA